MQTLYRRNPDQGDVHVADLIHDAGHSVATGPGRSVALLADVYEQIGRDGKTGGLSFDEFKCEVIRLHALGLLKLAPAAAARAQARTGRTAESALTIGGTTYHLLEVPRAGRARRSGTAPASAPVLSIDEFARRVLAIVEAVPLDQRFGDRKVFIGDVWSVARQDPAFRGMDERQFKETLVAAHQQAQLVLARADLVAAMDPERVAAAETIGNGAEFHFVKLEPPIPARRNPARSPRSARSARGPRFVRNPPDWVTEIIAHSYETLEDTVPAIWLPRLGEMVAVADGGVEASVDEYGCGAYGCVFPTLDPAVVMKVTSDSTEAEFAARLSSTLSRPVCVKYHTVIDTNEVYKRGHVYLLWRDSAEHVGKIEQYLDDKWGSPCADYAADLIDTQWKAAQLLFRAVMRGDSPTTLKPLIDGWLEQCDILATQADVPELNQLGEMGAVFVAQRIFFGDVHNGNIGMVKRPDGSEAWVITDPGHVAVIDI